MLIAGVDEAGRGPLFGPVYAAAVILPTANNLEDIGMADLNDSKKLSAKKRERLFACIQEQAIAWGIAKASAKEIDEINILQASLLAMQRAIGQLKVPPHKVLIDGLHCPKVEFITESVVKGDSKVPAIAAASILAKVARDRELLQLDAKYPEYGFAKHKGYPTREHLNKLEKLGVIAGYRKSFAPVREILKAATSTIAAASGKSRYADIFN